jgi:hypothetical protein
VDFPYTYDQVIEAISSTRGEGAHFFLTFYLLLHKEEVGADRFRSLLANAKLRGEDRMSIHVALAELDDAYAAELPGVLRSAGSVVAQQALLANLPELFKGGEHNGATAEALQDWISRRVKRTSYVENGASWEIPSVVLAISYSTDTSRARKLLRELDAHLDDRERPLAQAALAADDQRFEVLLKQWCSLDEVTQREQTVSESDEERAEIEREAAKFMRRLGFQPTT